MPGEEDGASPLVIWLIGTVVKCGALGDGAESEAACEEGAVFRYFAFPSQTHTLVVMLVEKIGRLRPHEMLQN